MPRSDCRTVRPADAQSPSFCFLRKFLPKTGATRKNSRFALLILLKEGSLLAVTDRCARNASRETERFACAAECNRAEECNRSSRPRVCCVRKWRAEDNDGNVRVLGVLKSTLSKRSYTRSAATMGFKFWRKREREREESKGKGRSSVDEEKRNGKTHGRKRGTDVPRMGDKRRESNEEKMRQKLFARTELYARKRKKPINSEELRIYVCVSYPRAVSLFFELQNKSQGQLITQ